MEDIQKKYPYYILIASICAFFLGILFDHYLLCKNDNINPIEPEPQLEILDKQSVDIDPKTISKEEGCTIYIDIAGSLKNPGVYCLPQDSLVVDAVNMAGGLTKESAYRFIERQINLAQPISNNQKIYFPYEKEVICSVIEFTQETKGISTEFPYTNNDQNQTPQTGDTGSNTNNSSDGQCVNINTATKDQLTTLNGIGEVTATKIIEGRPYATIEDLLDVSGIGEATFEKFKDGICI